MSRPRFEPGTVTNEHRARALPLRPSKMFGTNFDMDNMTATFTGNCFEAPLPPYVIIFLLRTACFYVLMSRVLTEETQ